MRVVEHDGLTIDELVGNVATNEDTMSAAKVVVTTPSSEPWLTLHYDEWICVLKGRCDMRFIGDDGEEEVLTVTAGDTCIRLINDDVDTISTGRVKDWEDWFSSLGNSSYAKAAAALTKTSTRLRRSAYIVSGVLFVFSSVCNIFELLLKYTYSS